MLTATIGMFIGMCVSLLLLFLLLSQGYYTAAVIMFLILIILLLVMPVAFSEYKRCGTYHPFWTGEYWSQIFTPKVLLERYTLVDNTCRLATIDEWCSARYTTMEECNADTKKYGINDQGECEVATDGQYSNMEECEAAKTEVPAETFKPWV